MVTTFTENSFNILGLPSSATQKDISRRSKEIIARLHVDDVPSYPNDLPILNGHRKEDSVREAVQKLSSPKKRIKEYFFWFQISDEIDDEAIKLLCNKNPNDAALVWEKRVEQDDIKSNLYRKNLAILYSLLLSTTKDNQFLLLALKNWNAIISSDKFWVAYLKLFKLHDELATSDDIFADFRQQVVPFLSDLFTEISQSHGDNGIYSEFTKAFSAKGGKIESNILAPIFERIESAAEELRKMNVSSDGVLDNEERAAIQGLLEKVKPDFQQIDDLGLKDDGQSKTMRDRFANALRSVTLDIYSNIGEVDESLSLMNSALQLSGTVGLRTKIEEDIQVITKNTRDSEVAKPIVTLVGEKKFSEALTLIESERKAHLSNSDLQEFYDGQEKLCIMAIALGKYHEADNHFKDNHEKAKALYFETAKLIYDHLDLFNFNREAIDRNIEKVKNATAQAGVSTLEHLDKYRNHIIELAKKSFEGQFEETTLIVLIDCHIYLGVIDILNRTEDAHRITAPIGELIDKKQYERALALIESEKTKYQDNVAIQEVLAQQKKLAVTVQAAEKYTEARKQFDNKSFNKAELGYAEVAKSLYANIDLFDISKEFVDKTLTEIRSNVEIAAEGNLSQFDDYREGYVKIAKEAFADKLEETYLVFLFDSELFGGLSRKLPGIRSKATRTNFISQVVGFAILAFIGWIISLFK